MSIRDQLDSDIASFFKNIEKQLPEDRKKTLILLIDKYAHLLSTPVLLEKYDFDMIKDHAAKFFLDNAFPKKIGDKKQEISFMEASSLSIVEGTIAVLNSKECLRKVPKFDYRA